MVLIEGASHVLAREPAPLGHALEEELRRDGIELVPTRVVEAPEVTHIRYTVTGPSKLVLDDRGASGDLVGPAQPEQSERSEL